MIMDLLLLLLMMMMVAVMIIRSKSLSPETGLVHLSKTCCSAPRHHQHNHNHH